MKPDSGNPFSAFSKPFAESALSAQALAFKGLQSMAEVQRKTVGEQGRAVDALVADAGQIRDLSGVRKLLLDTTDLGREGVARAVASAQAIAAIAQATVVSMSELIKPQGAAANETAVPQSAASKGAAAG